MRFVKKWNFGTSTFRHVTATFRHATSTSRHVNGRFLFWFVSKHFWDVSYQDVHFEDTDSKPFRERNFRNDFEEDRPKPRPTPSSSQKLQHGWSCNTLLSGAGQLDDQVLYQKLPESPGQLRAMEQAATIIISRASFFEVLKGMLETAASPAPTVAGQVSPLALPDPAQEETQDISALWMQAETWVTVLLRDPRIWMSRVVVAHILHRHVLGTRRTRQQHRLRGP